jgi:DNA-directed RNA polymerase subunit RPC12/RpoP
VLLAMLWKHDGGPRCPRCENRATILTERTVSNGVAVVRYTLKCPSCGFRDTLQELTVSRTSGGIRVRVGALGR